jgi:hypothetical protein
MPRLPVSDNALFWFVTIAGMAVIIAGSFLLGMALCHG